MAISDVWHFVEGGKRAGPFTEDEMRAFVQKGRVKSDTLVWCDGMTDWMPLRQSKGAALLLAGDGPTPPTVPPLPAGGYAPSSGGFAAPAEAGVATDGPGRPMGFFEAISSCFSKYVQFSGRASRSEYWYFWLFTLICSFAADLVGGTNGQYGVGALSGLVSLALLLPSLAANARRLHDTDRSGWWMLFWLLPVIGWIVMLIFLCQKPTPGRNRFG